MREGSLVVYSTPDTTIVWFIPAEHVLHSGVANLGGCFLGADNSEWEEETGKQESDLADFYQSCITAAQQGEIIKLVDGEDSCYVWSALVRLHVTQVVSCGEV
jgi:hypothetical protein